MNHFSEAQFFAGVAKCFEDLASTQHRLRFIAVTLALFHRPAAILCHRVIGIAERSGTGGQGVFLSTTRHPKFRHTELTRQRQASEGENWEIAKIPQCGMPPIGNELRGS
jgi:hypothetical protein